jgi:predicted DNA repair protein MutK
MTVVGVARFVAVLSTGLVAGILFGDRMGATFARPALPASSFVTFQQVLHLRFVPVMPILRTALAVLGFAASILALGTAKGSKAAA